MNLIERLIVNGSPLDIAGYSVNAPRDGMGTSLSILLPKPDPTSIPLDAEITFQLGAKVYNEISEEYDVSWATPLVANGQLAGRTYTVRWVEDENGGYPGDLIEFTSQSLIADRWSKCPDVPLVYFNPALIDADSIKYNDRDLIRQYGGYEGGFRLLRPTVTPVNDFNLHKLLDLCYVDGCGFDRVITNLPNPTLERQDIGIESGYHAAALSWAKKVSLRLLTWEDEGTLYMYDPGRGLPSTFPIKSLPLDCVIDVVQSYNPSIIANAVILSYKSDAGGGVAGEIPKEVILPDEPQESGSGRDYVRTEGYTRKTEYYDAVSNELRRTLEHEIVKRVYGYKDDITVTTCFLNTGNVYEITGTGVVKRAGVVIANGTPNPGNGGEISIEGFSYGNVVKGQEVVHRKRIDGGVVLMSEDILENRYTGNTKAGHTRTLKGWYTNPNTRGTPAYGTLIEEENTSVWTADLSHPGESVLKSSTTTLSGLCLKEFLEDGYLAYTPIQDADEGNLVKGDLSQTTEFKPFETHIVEIQKTAQNQANVIPRIIDHLGGRPRRTGMDNRPGSLSTYIPNFAVAYAGGGTIRELIEDAESVALYGRRKPLTLDVDRLEPEEGRLLARRMIEEAKSPPKTVNINLPGIDFTIRRGTVILPPLRSGFDTKHIVEAWGIVGSNLGDPETATRRMRLECSEVKDAPAS